MPAISPSSSPKVKNSAEAKWSSIALFEAIERMDLEALTHCLKKKEELARVPHPESLLTPLMQAVEQGFVEAVRALIPHSELEARVQEKTALMCAIKSEQVKCLKLLLKAGASAAVCDNLNNTPLMLAAERGFSAGMQLLIEASSQKEKETIGTQTNFLGQTALLRTMESWADQCEDLPESAMQREQLHERFVRCVRLLMPFSFFNPSKNEATQAKTSRFALGERIWAVGVNDKVPGLLLALLREGVDPNLRSVNGRNALMHAVVKNNPEAVRTLRPLCQAGASDRNGLNALMLSCLRFDPSAQITQLLLSEVEAHAQDQDGETALMIAVDQGSLEQVKTLLGRSDPDARDQRGRTALMHAIQGSATHGWPSLSMLMEASTLSVQNLKGQTAADCAWEEITRCRLQDQSGSAIATRKAMDVFAPLWSRDRLVQVVYGVKEGEMPRARAAWERLELAAEVESTETTSGLPTPSLFDKGPRSSVESNGVSNGSSGSAQSVGRSQRDDSPVAPPPKGRALRL